MLNPTRDEYAIGFQVYKTQDANQRLTRATKEDQVLKSGSYEFEREVSLESVMQPGQYIIVPSTFEPNSSAKFVLILYSQKEITLSYIKPTGEVEVSRGNPMEELTKGVSQLTFDKNPRAPRYHYDPYHASIGKISPATGAYSRQQDSYQQASYNSPGGHHAQSSSLHHTHSNPTPMPHHAQSTPHYAQSTPHYAQSTPHYAQSTPHYAQSTPHYTHSNPHHAPSSPSYAPMGYQSTPPMQGYGGPHHGPHHQGYGGPPPHVPHHQGYGGPPPYGYGAPMGYPPGGY